jgi:hypothetical protein
MFFEDRPFAYTMSSLTIPTVYGAEGVDDFMYSELHFFLSEKVVSKLIHLCAKLYKIIRLPFLIKESTLFFLGCTLIYKTMEQLSQGLESLNIGVGPLVIHGSNHRASPFHLP